MNTLSLPQLGIEVPHVQLSRTSLIVGTDATDHDYAQLDALLDHVGGSLQWWHGDYLNHLATARGVDYAEAKAAGSYSPGALRNATWVCRHVAVSRRRDALSFAHHQEVAALSPTDQEIWLCRAEDEEWNVKQLRAAIRASKAKVQNGADQAPEDPRAAKASESFEVFALWYQKEAPNFTAEQRREWDNSLEPIIEEWLTRNRDHATIRLKELAR